MIRYCCDRCDVILMFIANRMCTTTVPVSVFATHEYGMTQ